MGLVSCGRSQTQTRAGASNSVQTSAVIAVDVLALSMVHATWVAVGPILVVIATSTRMSTGVAQAQIGSVV